MAPWGDNFAGIRSYQPGDPLGIWPGARSRAMIRRWAGSW
jgi:hypothetical protein